MRHVADHVRAAALFSGAQPPSSSSSSGPPSSSSSTARTAHVDAFAALDLQQIPRTPAPYAVVFVDGGGSYWHQRRNGEDAGALVATALLPRLADHGLDPGRLALMGWSMGGYGALLLAATMLRGKVRAVATMSAALWTAPGASAPGAFDDADDFAAHGHTDDHWRATAPGLLALTSGHLD